MSAILAFLTHPEKNPVIRYNDRFTSRPTAIASPNEWVDVPAKPDATVTTMVGPGGIVAFAFRDALRANIHYDPNTSNTPIEYNVYFQDALTSDVEGAAPTPSLDFEFPAGITDIQVAYLEASSAYQPHGPYLYCGVDLAVPDHRSYFWIDEGERFFCSVTDIDAVVQICLNRWMPSEVQPKAYSITLSNAYDKTNRRLDEDNNSSGAPTAELSSLSLNHSTEDIPVEDIPVPRHNDSRGIRAYHKHLLSRDDCHSVATWQEKPRPSSRRPRAVVLSGSIQVTVAGYYSLSVLSTTEGLLTQFEASVGKVADGSAKPHFCHRPISQFPDIQGITTAYRVLAVSMLLENQTKVLDKDGSLTMTQAPPGVTWLEYVSGKSIAQDNNAYKGNLEKGGYGFLSPTREADFAEIIESNADNSSVMTRSFFDLRSPGGFLALQGQTSAPDDFSAKITFAYGVEFLTTSMWFGQSKTTTHPESYNQALDHIKDITQFNENPFHIKDLISGVRKAVDVAIRYGPPLMRGARALSNMLA
jgi:hypothetical protein